MLAFAGMTSKTSDTMKTLLLASGNQEERRTFVCSHIGADYELLGAAVGSVIVGSGVGAGAVASGAGWGMSVR